MERSGMRTAVPNHRQAQTNDVVEIDLVELLLKYLEKWYWIILSGVLVAALMGVYTFRFVTPTYQSTSKLYVVSSKNSAINLSDLQIGNYMAKDYQQVFTNWHVHERVIQTLNLKYSYTELNRMVNVTNPSDTRILYITVTSTDPVEAKEMANTYAKVASEFIEVKMDQDQPSIFEEARVPSAPSAPNKTRNILLGFLIGAILAAGVITIQFLADDKVRTAEDIEKILQLPTLGVVTEQMDFHSGHSHESGKRAKNKNKGGKA